MAANAPCTDPPVGSDTSAGASNRMAMRELAGPLDRFVLLTFAFQDFIQRVCLNPAVNHPSEAAERVYSPVQRNR